MPVWVIGIVVAVVVVTVAVVVALNLRTTPSPPTTVDEPVPPIDLAERRARQQALAQQGTELLKRRVQLDSRRGTLDGNTLIEDAFERLEQRLREGQISEEEFESEKYRLLGG